MKIISLILIFCGLSASSQASQNSAAVKCANLGGVSINSDCQIDEWALYFQMLEAGKVIQHQAGPGANKNPATMNCFDQGGYVNYTETESGMVGTCVINEWTLFNIMNK